MRVVGMRVGRRDPEDGQVDGARVGIRDGIRGDQDGSTDDGIKDGEMRDGGQGSTRLGHPAEGAAT